MTPQDYQKSAQELTSGPIAPERLAVINRVMFPEFPTDAKTDIALVLSAGIMSPLLAAAAAKLLTTGKVAKIVLSGGAVVNDLPETKQLLPMFQQAKISAPVDGETEADYMHRLLTAQGMPSAKLVVENTSRNTGENIVNSLPLIAGVKSVTIVALPGPRTVMTFRHHIPFSGDIEPKDWVACNLHAVLPPGVTKENWQHVPFAKAYILSEFAKVDVNNPENYVAQGFCTFTAMPFEATLVKVLNREPSVPVPTSTVPRGMDF